MIGTGRGSETSETPKIKGNENKQVREPGVDGPRYAREDNCIGFRALCCCCWEMKVRGGHCAGILKWELDCILQALYSEGNLRKITRKSTPRLSWKGVWMRTDIVRA